MMEDVENELLLLEDPDEELVTFDEDEEEIVGLVGEEIPEDAAVEVLGDDE
jgi:hypothetical protein